MSRSREALVRRDSSLPRIDLRNDADVDAYYRALDAQRRRDQSRAVRAAWMERQTYLARQRDAQARRCKLEYECLLDNGHVGPCDLQEYD